jgi:heat shock protein HtpX
MAIARRIALFLVVNVLVMITVTTLLSVLGVGSYMSASGIDITSLMAFCLVWGSAGSLISLLLSKVMAKWTMGLQVIDPNVRDPELRDLVETVHAYARRAGLTTMPEVAIYDSREVNAFATGPSSSSSLVAVSSGLLRVMSRSERNGVISHEIAHIANGDMVTLTLVQGIVNAFAMFFARLLAYVVSSQLRRDDDDRGGGIGQFLLVQVFQVAFTLLGAVVVAWFSRWREYRADAGGAEIGGRQEMVMALQRLRSMTAYADDGQRPAIAAMKISMPGGISRWFATHPPLEDRIEALRRA